ncbi:hypothetical protein A7R75_26900 [Mycolicibacterium llatzerense]|nr:hypothetical protein [Mycolicibacterium llatzerense]
MGLLIIVQAAGVAASLVSLIVLPMTTDNCAYVECGPEKWITWAIWMQFGAAAVAGLSTLAGLIMFARNRIGFWLPLMGCVVQWGIIVAAWWVAGLAGPIAG